MKFYSTPAKQNKYLQSLSEKDELEDKKQQLNYDIDFSKLSNKEMFQTPFWSQSLNRTLLTKFIDVQNRVLNDLYEQQVKPRFPQITYNNFVIFCFLQTSTSSYKYE